MARTLDGWDCALATVPDSVSKAAMGPGLRNESEAAIPFSNLRIFCAAKYCSQLRYVRTAVVRQVSSTFAAARSAEACVNSSFRREEMAVA